MASPPLAVLIMQWSVKIPSCWTTYYSTYNPEENLRYMLSLGIDMAHYPGWIEITARRCWWTQRCFTRVTNDRQENAREKNSRGTIKQTIGM